MMYCLQSAYQCSIGSAILCFLMSLAKEENQLVRLLEKLMKAQSKKAVGDVEMTLSMVERFPNFFGMMLRVIQMKQNTHCVRRLAAAILHNFIRNQLTTQISETNIFTMQILTVLENPLVDFSLKRQLSSTLAEIVKRESKKENYHFLVETLKQCHTPEPQDNPKLDLCILLGRILLDTQRLAQVDLPALFAGYIEIALTIENFFRIKTNGDIGILFGLSERLEELLKLIACFFDHSEENLLGQPTRLTRLMLLVPFDTQRRNFTQQQMQDNREFCLKITELKVNSFDILSKLLQRCPNIASGMVQEFNEKVCSTVREIMNGMSELFTTDNLFAFGGILEGLMESQLNFLSRLYHSPFFSNIMKEHDLILLKLVSGILVYKDQEIVLFASEPIAFTNIIVEIIEARIEKQNEQEPFNELPSLKASAAKLLVLIAKARPTLSQQITTELITTSKAFIEQRKQCICPLLMLNILKESFSKEQVCIIEFILTNALSTPIPVFFRNNEKLCVQYAFYLASASTFIQDIRKSSQQFIKNILFLAIQIVSNSEAFEVYQIIACEIIQALFRTTQSNQWLIVGTLQLLNKHLQQGISSRRTTIYLLDAIFIVVHNYQRFQVENCPYLEAILKNIGICIQKELRNLDSAQIVINKCWNVIREISDKQVVLNNMLKTIEETIAPFVDHLMHHLSGGFEEDCFILMTSFIRHFKSAGKYVLEMYKLIPLFFYKQYKGRFGHSFQALQLFIYYGSDLLCQSKALLREIMEMCFFSMKLNSDIDSCEGVYLLHSVILSTGKCLPEQTIVFIFQQIQKKLLKERITKNLRHALIGLQGICVASSNFEWVSPRYFAVTFKRILEELCRPTDKYFLKIVLLSSCSIILKISTKHICHFIYDFLNILKHCSILFDQHSIQPDSSNSQCMIIKESIVNIITKMNFKEYFIAFVSKFQKAHADFYKIFVEEIKVSMKQMSFMQGQQ